MSDYDSLRITGLTENLAKLTARLAALEKRLGDAVQVDVQLSELFRIAAILTAKEEARPKRPEPSVRWWALEPEEREAAVARLRAWARDIYVPGFGHLAAQLPACWGQHDLCLYVLDVLSQTWMTFWLPEKRSLSILGGQLDLFTRQIGQMVSLMQAEAAGCKNGCKHAAAGANGTRR